MEKNCGLWIDHRKAVIVSLTGKDVKTILIESNVEGHFRVKGGSRSKDPFGPQSITSESRHEERYKTHLSQYYQRVIKEIEDTDEIYIFGPGEAKSELKKEIEKIKPLSGKIVGLETVDKMTCPQIVAKARKFFIDHIKIHAQM